MDDIVFKTVLLRGAQGVQGEPGTADAMPVGGVISFEGQDIPEGFEETTIDNVPTKNSNNVVESGGIYASEKDIYAVMGEMGAKNILIYPYSDTSKSENGVSFTDNGNGTVKVETDENGATENTYFIFENATRKFLLKKGTYILSDGTGLNDKIAIQIYKRVSPYTTYAATTNGNKTFTMEEDTEVVVRLNVNEGAITTGTLVKPMLRLASDTDDTYQQYAKTNKQLTDEIANKVDKVEGKGLSTNDYDNTEKGKVADNTAAIEAIVNEYGACNFCPTSATTTTKYGITFTVNSDGSVTVSGIADSGHVATIDIMPKTDLHYGTYKGSGGVNEHCRVIYGRSNSSGTLIDTVDDSGEGIELTVNASTPKVSMALIIDAGTDLTTPVTFYPMLYDARLNPTGYVPYAMTNRELTERVILEKEIDIGGKEITYDENGVYYTSTLQLVEVATGAHIVEVSQLEGSWMPNVSYMVLKRGNNDVIALTSPQRFTVPTGKKLFVKYWV